MSDIIGIGIGKNTIASKETISKPIGETIAGGGSLGQKPVINGKDAASVISGRGGGSSEVLRSDKDIPGKADAGKKGDAAPKRPFEAEQKAYGFGLFGSKAQGEATRPLTRESGRVVDT